MCGIVGYIGNRNSQNILLEGLKKLEYRGYDSAGVAIHTEAGLELRKTKGRISELETRLEAQPLTGFAGIGHTRWATHGKPSDANSHPHTDNDMKISVVHNGIIENHLQLKEELEQLGYRFLSETDTEVISHLIAHHYEGDLTEAVRKAVSQVRGAYAIAVLSEHEPDKLVAVRWASPLIIGVGQGENFIGSDIPAILEYTRDVYILNDGEMAVLTRDGVELMTLEGNFIAKQLFHIDWDLMMAEKNGFDTFMLKEIHDQPRAYQDTMRGRINEGKEIVLPGMTLSAEQIRGLKQIHMVACGTAYHAALVGKTVIERLTRIPVEVDLASEYRYRMPVIRENTLVIAVSQSGETADTLAAMREARQCGARVMAITNVIGSSVAREADDVLFTLAGPEIAVASTKAYSSQLIAFYLLGLFMAQSMETLDQASLIELIAMLERLPSQVEEMLEGLEPVRQIAEQISNQNHLFFIGRGLDYSLAMEASLKLKEISYIHSEAYAAGELKHGSLALIEEGTPVIALATQELLLEKTASNIKEVKARGAYVIALALEGQTELEKTADQVIYVPRTYSLLAPALAVVPLQLLAYYTASIRGNDVDKPRNLAKSVTVE
ncbi:glutamine--fructose-6-phosphate transaminase (isomerizing) [Paenibacillus validus]|uniref:Glutamine--fructose-6-phosphate aminotransferase [isomerizing] n=1 Tax=Paenibacillus validus TaxID=44253 RepID=A0A7X2Z8H4_9BACL|nr:MULTISPECIES: glutamine--fructose-6-phosphate transaminase (isomerizing) [Paenibacillus]MED4601073.1 glutamine--fructose-6-phosphate transaminase (isomerizing) [Paenibacillus validus]MED4607456.1 glutamine--fructose-6-phosphate transaminase (isomerizing) [Paenibacillus validus]MUG70289.1 glutamine--fructose-6-phosphate transaminase (isomerizing) [Paenibacillus validus]